MVALPVLPQAALRAQEEVRMRHTVCSRGLVAAGLSLAMSVGLLAGAAGTASAKTDLPVSYSFAASFASTFGSPDVPPPGANNFSCKPSSAHPYPVVLVNGTLENMNDEWQSASPILANHGYCVFAFNYGAAPGSDFQGTGNIAASAQTLATFVSQVLAATGAAKVDLVGHSQGGMMPRYYINFLGGASKVDKLVALAPSNYGTTLDGLVALAQKIGLFAPVSSSLAKTCEACLQQVQGSSFLATLNAVPTVPGVSYTVIETRDDEVVTPYTNAFLPSAANVTNITVNNQCWSDFTDHTEIAYDPVAMADMLNALDPAQPVRVPCLLVLPVFGPLGSVPPF
jgi:triacylglycerol esterase/lipase EstA (alpha/beta hydrolase family)